MDSQEFINTNDDKLYYCDHVISGSTAYRPTPSRHNSSRCCDVPTLQSPKNAVAPTQTLIATSNGNTDYTGNLQRVKNALVDQQAMKKELEVSTKEESRPSIIPMTIQNSAGSASSGLINGGCTQTFYLNGIGNSPNAPSSLQTCHNFVHARNTLNSGSNNVHGTLTNGGTAAGGQSVVLQQGKCSVCSAQVNGNFNSPGQQCYNLQASACGQGALKRKDSGKGLVCCVKSATGHHVGVSPTKVDELRFIDEEVSSQLFFF